MDFITGLPRTIEGFDAILVVMCKLSRLAHLIPTTEKCTAEQTAELFMRHVYKHHGLPAAIISDRDPRFTSHFWQAIHAALGTLLSTAFHPQTDGSTERLNQSIEDMLRSFVSAKHTEWSRFLHLVEFAHNAAPNAGTGVPPFYLDRGLRPRTMLSACLPTTARCLQLMPISTTRSKP